jgi:hypothetical protein
MMTFPYFLQVVAFGCFVLATISNDVRLHRLLGAGLALWTGSLLLASFH